MSFSMRTDGQTRRRSESIFAILQKRLKKDGMDNFKTTLTNRYSFAIQITDIKIYSQYYAF
jgi:hypothetical protein